MAAKAALLNFAGIFLRFKKNVADICRNSPNFVGMLTKIDPLKSLIRSENKESYPLNNSECNYNGEPSTTGVSKHYISEFKINNINICLIDQRCGSLV